MSSRPIEPGKWYAGRNAGIQPIQLSLDVEAVKLLRHFATTPKSHGRFISRLIFEHAAVQAERRRLLELVPAGAETENGED